MTRSRRLREAGQTASGTLKEGLQAESRRGRGQLAALREASRSAVRLRNDILPELVLVSRPPDKLLPPTRNVRKVGAAQVRQVANAIAVLGFCDPILVDRSGRIIDGVVRVEAAKLLGLPFVPCVVADHLGQAEIRLLRVALNRLGEKGEWAIDELRVELEELIANDSPIEVSGFALDEVDVILSSSEVESVEKGPVAPEPDAQAVATLGDTFLLGAHRVACGDARDAALVRALMGLELAQLVLTDEPYNVPIAGHVTGGRHREFKMASGEMSREDFAAFNAAWIAAAVPALVEGGVLGTFIDWRGLGSVTSAALEGGLEQLNLIVWGKTNAGMGSLYRSQHELLPLFKKGRAAHVNNVKLGRTGRWRSNLWTYPGASTIGSHARRGLEDHPTVKPVAMLADALLDLTSRGDIVLDPFLGSGSTILAAERTGRVCHGIELDPLYVDVIVHRYQAVTGRPATLESTGETFSALTSRRAQELASLSDQEGSREREGTGASNNNSGLGTSS